MSTLSKEVQEQIRKEAEERYPMHSADAINAKPDMEDRRTMYKVNNTMYKVNSHVMMTRIGYIAGATVYAEKGMEEMSEWTQAYQKRSAELCEGPLYKELIDLRSQLAEKDARIKELEKEVERLRREIGEVALAGLALGNKANQGNG